MWVQHQQGLQDWMLQVSLEVTLLCFAKVAESALSLLVQPSFIISFPSPLFVGPTHCFWPPQIHSLMTQPLRTPACRMIRLHFEHVNTGRREVDDMVGGLDSYWEKYHKAKEEKTKKTLLSKIRSAINNTSVFWLCVLLALMLAMVRTVYNKISMGFLQNSHLKYFALLYQRSFCLKSTWSTLCLWSDLLKCQG